VTVSDCPLCPECQQEISNFNLSMADGEETTAVCTGCKAHVRVRCLIDVQYETELEE
jgi:hypothetical protein